MAERIRTGNAGTNPSARTVQRRTVAEELWAEPRVADALCSGLQRLGAQHAFGVIGGAILPFHDALERSELRVRHFQHESGAAYAATENSIVGDRLAVVFATTGPGLTNAISGLVAARHEGAAVVLVTGHTKPGQRGRFPIQETSQQAMAGSGMFEPGGMFDVAWTVESAGDLKIALRQLAALSQRPQGFVAHLSMSLPVQALRCAPVAVCPGEVVVHPHPNTLDRAVDALGAAPFAVWVGHGARRDAAAVRSLLQRTGAPFMATPRGKGIVDEQAPSFLGVTGLGGHDNIGAEIERLGVRTILVLGSRLGELSSFYDESLSPSGGFVHVDIDPRVAGMAYPDVPVIPIQAHIGPTLEALEVRLASGAQTKVRSERPQPLDIGRPRATPRVRPEFLLDAIQAQVIERSSALFMAESGNSFCWANNRLRFRQAERYRIAGMFCPMGHVTAGAVGAAMATEHPVVALVGDGAMLMQNEISTAVRYRANIKWIVLNDGVYGMVDKGMQGLGYPKAPLDFPEVDFASFAQALGCRGIAVVREDEVVSGLEAALAHEGPVVLDVKIVQSTASPLGARNKSLSKQTGDHR